MTHDKNKFFSDLKSAKVGEKKVMERLAREGWDVTDVSMDPLYQGRDIDLLIQSGDDEVTVEVKYDSFFHKTRNFFLETYSYKEKDIIGWFDICEADMVVYVDKKNDMAYCFCPIEMREYVQRTRPRLIETNADYPWKTSVGYLVSSDQYRKMHSDMEIFSLSDDS